MRRTAHRPGPVPALWAGVSCREGRCAACLHCAAHRPGVLPGGTRGQVSWCPSRVAYEVPVGLREHPRSEAEGAAASCYAASGLAQRNAGFNFG